MLRARGMKVDGPNAFRALNRLFVTLQWHTHIQDHEELLLSAVDSARCSSRRAAVWRRHSRRAPLSVTLCCELIYLGISVFLRSFVTTCTKGLSPLPQMLPSITLSLASLESPSPH